MKTSQLKSKVASKLASKIAFGALLIAVTPLTAGAETLQPTTIPPLAPIVRWENKESIVHQTSRQLTVELNEKTVLCSRADYAMPVLKVLIPGLADITLLNHQNTGAGAPCVTSGDVCGLGSSVEAMELIGGGPGTESIVVDVVAKRITHVDNTNRICQVSLREEVETTLRGKKWVHVVEASLGERPYNDCL